MFVKHFIIRKTVEQKVLAIQKRKTAIVSSSDDFIDKDVQTEDLGEEHKSN